MKVEIRPSAPVTSVQAPPSKSAAHRLLICAGLAQGISRINGISESEDMLATIDCLESLGAGIVRSGDVLEIRGTDPLRAGSAVFRCRESGSTLRFFAPLCALSGSRMLLVGSDHLMRRPMGVYEEVLSGDGRTFEETDEGIIVRGPLQSGEYMMDASVSSQFISGMLFALPLTAGDSIIRLLPPVESKSYIDMTIDAMKKFGVSAEWADELTIRIPGGQQYTGADLTVEGDWSNAAFLLALGADVSGLDDRSLQGDRVCMEHFAALDKGCAEIDISDCPDLGPVLMAYAALRHGVRLTGTRRLKYKESDRGSAMKEELAAFGVEVMAGEDTITVRGRAHAPERELYGHNDHRIVMALTVLCAHTGGTIEGAEAVSKSFPDFFDCLTASGVSAEVISS